MATKYVQPYNTLAPKIKGKIKFDQTHYQVEATKRMGNWAGSNEGWAQNSASSLLKRIYWPKV